MFSSLLYCLGEEANEVLASTNITKEECKKFDTVLQKFDKFFRVQHNIIFERERFNQLSGDSMKKYITELYHQAENSKYRAAMNDEIIRDGLVVELLDKKVSQQLQMDSSQTVGKTKTTIRKRLLFWNKDTNWKITRNVGSL